MTTQFADTLCLEGREFSIIEIVDDAGRPVYDFVTPEDFGMNAQMISTANRKGFTASYAFVQGQLQLRDFGLSEKNGNYLSIAGVPPKRQSETNYADYSNVKLPLSVTGKVRIGRDGGWRVDLANSPHFAYGIVLDLTLKNGLIVDVVDRSTELLGETPPLARSHPRSGKLRRYLDNL